MGRPAYNCQVLVLRKTRLGEADLVLDLLRDDGSLLRAVAKGACKPKSTFAARLDLFCVSDCLVAPGKRLAVVSEARLQTAHLPLRADAARMAAAAPVLEALSRTCHEDLPLPRLFAAACAALDAAEAADVEATPALCAAFLLKLFAFLGVRPQLSRCLSCGADVRNRPSVDFSFPDGGAYCTDCAGLNDHVRVPAQTLAWAEYLLGSTFADVAGNTPPQDVGFGVLEFCHRFLRENLDVNLRSLNFLFTAGLF